MAYRPDPKLVITVGSQGADYKFLGQALTEAATVASSSNRILVEVQPGVYNEANPLTVPEWVVVRGGGSSFATTINLTAGGIGLTSSGNCSIEYIRIIGTAANTGISSSVAGTTNVQNCTALNCGTGFSQTGTGKMILELSFALVDGVAATYGFTASGGSSMDAIDCQLVVSSGSLTGGFHAEGVGTFMSCRSCIADGADLCYHVDGASSVGWLNSSARNCTTAYCVEGGAASTPVAILGSTAIGATTDLEVVGSNAIVTAAACFLDNNKLILDPAASFTISHVSINSLESALGVKGELVVGSPENPSESVFGEGDSYVRGVQVWTETAGGAFADITADATTNGGSTFTFPGVATNNAIYVCSTLSNTSGKMKPQGIKSIISTAGVYGGGNIVAEFWNGASWESFTTMRSNSSYPYNRLGNNLFTTTGGAQIRYNPKILNTWVANDPVSLGTTYYWVRFRIAAGITTAPIMDFWKVHSDRTEINSDGFMEYFGRSRPAKTLPFDASNWDAANQSPGNADQYVTGTLAVGRVENSFLNAANNRSGFVTPLSADIDTSAPIRFQLHWGGSVAAAGTNIRWEFTIGVSTDGSTMAITSPGAPTVQQIQQVIVEAGPVAADTQVTTQVDLDISSFAPVLSNHPLLWVAIRRNANDAADTYNGDARIAQVTGYYVAWNNGAPAAEIYQ